MKKLGQVVSGQRWSPPQQRMVDTTRLKIECDCGRSFILHDVTNTCECGEKFNLYGQRLRRDAPDLY